VNSAMPNFDGRRFHVTANAQSGESGERTVFSYRQHGDIVWATYAGGEIRFGLLIGRLSPDGGLEIRYQHLNRSGQFRCGQCVSTLEILSDGRYRLHERWAWTEPPSGSGTSIAEELKNQTSG
jgi:hypothetical protein